jgi:hypothetical protein
VGLVEIAGVQRRLGQRTPRPALDVRHRPLQPRDPRQQLGTDAHFPLEQAGGVLAGPAELPGQRGDGRRHGPEQRTHGESQARIGRRHHRQVIQQRPLQAVRRLIEIPAAVERRRPPAQLQIGQGDPSIRQLIGARAQQRHRPARTEADGHGR